MSRRNLVALLYLVSGVLFILALRGLSHRRQTSRHGNIFGMVGMAIAIVTTLLAAPPAGISPGILIVVGIAIGGGIGAVIARRIAMTAMPQLVAAFHSLVGLAAVFVAAAALLCAGSLRHRRWPATSMRGAWSRCRSAPPSAPSPSPARSSPSPSSMGACRGAPIMLPRPASHQYRARRPARRCSSSSSSARREPCRCSG